MVAEFAHIRICGETSSAFSSSFSIFARLAQGHLKLLYSEQSGARPGLRTMWCLVAVFRGLLFSIRLCCLYNIPDNYVNSRSHTSRLPPTHCAWTHLLQAGNHAIYTALLPGNTCVLFTFGNRFISCLFFVPMRLLSSMPPTQFMRNVKRDLQVNFQQSYT